MCSGGLDKKLPRFPARQQKCNEGNWRWFLLRRQQIVQAAGHGGDLENGPITGVVALWPRHRIAS